MLVVVLLSHLSLSAALQSGIFGGREAKKHSRPYMASLQVRGDHRCGGVLIREDYVLTAAHCLNRSDPNARALEVVLGAHDISNRQESSQQRIQVKQFHRHPQFRNPEQFDYDIMLLKLKSKAKLSKFVRLMGLPKKDGKVPERVRCWVAGWGMRTPKSQAETRLQEAPVQVETQKRCKELWQDFFNTTHMMCSNANQGKGFCQGDSGGPLVCNTKVQGIDAYTSPVCTDRSYPQVYTRVSAFLPWIKKVMGKRDSDP